MASDRWTEKQTQQALYLYFQMPFGRLHQRAPEIIELATEMGRTPSSIAMKLSNFASLDPEIIRSGRKGLAGASALDRAVFAHFYGQWDRLVEAVEGQQIETDIDPVSNLLRDSVIPFAGFVGPSESARMVAARRGQSFFRRAVLANFEEQCCITGIADPRLLNASHIKPWQEDVANRHNPANGFALTATFDRAFDRGLMTIDEGMRVKMSRELLESPSKLTRTYFTRYHKAPIQRPTRFDPDLNLLAWHNQFVFERGLKNYTKLDQ
jgi:putative restriction endonuclease